MAILEGILVLVGIILLIVGVRIKSHSMESLIGIIFLLSIGVTCIALGIIALLFTFIPTVSFAGLVINRFIIIFVLVFLILFILLLSLAVFVMKRASNVHRVQPH